MNYCSLAGEEREEEHEEEEEERQEVVEREEVVGRVEVVQEDVAQLTSAHSLSDPPRTGHAH